VGVFLLNEVGEIGARLGEADGVALPLDCTQELKQREQCSDGSGQVLAEEGAENVSVNSQIIAAPEEPVGHLVPVIQLSSQRQR
jgi:hypothetical protein